MTPPPPNNISFLNCLWSLEISRIQSGLAKSDVPTSAATATSLFFLRVLLNPCDLWCIPSRNVSVRNLCWCTESVIPCHHGSRLMLVESAQNREFARNRGERFPKHEDNSHRDNNNTHNHNSSSNLQQEFCRSHAQTITTAATYNENFTGHTHNPNISNLQQEFYRSHAQTITTAETYNKNVTHRAECRYQTWVLFESWMFSTCTPTPSEGWKDWTTCKT